MDKEQLVGILIWAIAVLGSGVLFFGIGIWAERSQKPVHFWSGSKMDARKISDVPGYNHANAVMWKWYSVPYFLSGVLGCLDSIHPWCMPIAVILLVLACLPGCLILVWRYSQIENTFILR